MIFEPKFGTHERISNMVNWSTKPYSKNDFINAWNSSISIAEVIRKLGYKNPGGGTYGTIRNASKELGLKTDHMLGQGHMKGKKNPSRTKRPLSDLLVKGKYVGSLRLRLIDEGILEPKCSECEITEWNGKTAPLELDHIDGDNTNNLLENLRILCCNCHAQTLNYKSKNTFNKIKPKYFCIDCNNVLKTSNAKRCAKCHHKVLANLAKERGRARIIEKSKTQKQISRTKIIWPKPEVLESRAREIGFSALGRELGVSDNAVRKHLKKFR